jgi:hypothetical protein
MYGSWRNMKRRVLEESHAAYKYYGAKGIQLDPSWLDFVQFYRDNGATWFWGAHLHRINKQLGYFPGNCVWLGATAHQKLHARLRAIELGRKKYGQSTSHAVRAKKAVKRKQRVKRKGS